MWCASRARDQVQSLLGISILIRKNWKKDPRWQVRQPQIERKTWTIMKWYELWARVSEKFCNIFFFCINAIQSEKKNNHVTNIYVGWVDKNWSHLLNKRHFCRQMQELLELQFCTVVRMTTLWWSSKRLTC